MPLFYSYITQTPNEPEMVDEPKTTFGMKTSMLYIKEDDIQNVIDTCRKEWPGKSFKIYTYRAVFNPDTFKLVHRFDSTK